MASSVSSPSTEVAYNGGAHVAGMATQETPSTVRRCAALMVVVMIVIIVVIVAAVVAVVVVAIIIVDVASVVILAGVIVAVVSTFFPKRTVVSWENRGYLRYCCSY